jgi:DNA-binding transcriptional regulator YdaS (Cro superfamily)
MAGAIAAHLGITASAVSRWDMIPAERVGPVADYTGWARSRLRPDLWPPVTRKRKAKAKRKKAKINGAGRRTDGADR